MFAETINFHKDFNISEPEKEELRAFQAELRKFHNFNGTNSEEESVGYTLEEWSALSTFNMHDYVRNKMGRDLTPKDKRLIRIDNYEYFDFLSKTFEENRKLVLDYQLIKLYNGIENYFDGDCFNLAIKDMYPLVEALVREKFHLDFVKSTSEKLVMDLRTEFRRMFGNARWVTQETRDKVLEGLNDLEGILVHFNKPLSRGQLHSFYKPLNTRTKTFFELRLRVGRLNAQQEFKDTTGDLNDLLYFKRQNGYTEIAVLNAFYNPNNNKIQIPYPLIGKPLALKETPPFVNYAGLGTWVGHEIGHGIDHYLTKTSDKEYESIRQCFVTQYNGFVEPLTNKSVDGLKTLDENMADYFGARVAYKASFGDDHGDWRGLPGLEDFNLRQQFWMHWSTNECRDISEKGIESLMENDVHSLPRFRVNGVVQNLADFARDFQCSSEAKMSSEKRCIEN